MSLTHAVLSNKDNASGQLSAGINNSVTSVPLLSGNGANFPQPYSGTATSGGTGTTLNCTGISATIGGSGQAGKIIWNKTDNSIAMITAVGTNALTTTRLIKGDGSAGTWNNGDTWCIDAFVATFAVVSTSTYGVQTITQYEEALIVGRSTDTLTVASGGRGYNGTTANTFSTNDYVYLFVTAPFGEGLKAVLSVVAQQVDTNVTNIATNTTNVTNLQTGTYHYVTTSGSANAYVAATPALGAYAAGNLVVFNANFTNTGSATLNLNSLGAKTIKKLDGATNLVSGDIVSGQVVVVRYDGTNFQMLSPVANVPAVKVSMLYSSSADSNSVSGTSETDINTNVAIAGNDMAAGSVYRFEAFLLPKNINGTLRVYLGSTLLLTLTVTENGNSATRISKLDCMVTCRSTGGSGSVAASAIISGYDGTNPNVTNACTNTTVTVDTTASQTYKISYQGTSGAGSFLARNVAITKMTT
jgi:hypothetical protein